MVEWALLVGNDFTEAIYDAVEFHDLPEMMLRRGRSPHEVCTRKLPGQPPVSLQTIALVWGS